MVGKQQLDDGLARFQHFGGMGVDLHALGHLGHTRSHQRTGALDFHHANAAGADFVQVFEKTQGGNGYARFRRGVENRRSFLYGDGHVVDF